MTRFALIFCWVILLLPAISFADDAKLRLGMSSAFSGPASQIGTDLHFGAQTYFSKYAPDRIDLIAMDDGYEPTRTVANTRKLLINDKVDALFSYMGTPTTFAVIPQLKAHNALLLMPYTGAERLHSEDIKFAFNLRTSYYSEAEVQIAHLLRKKVRRIALLIQADEFGLSAERGLIKAMKQHNLSPVITTRFRRNTKDIEGALTAIMATDAQAIAMVGTYEPLSTFINKAAELNFSPYYTSMSFVSSSSLYEQLTHPTKLFVTEAVPSPLSCRLKLCLQFIADMKQHGVTHPNRVQLEGYLNAYALVQASKTCNKRDFKTCIIPALASLLHSDEQLDLIFVKNAQKGVERTVYHSVYQE